MTADIDLYINNLHNQYGHIIEVMEQAGDPRASALKRIARQPISFWVVDEVGINGLKDIVDDAGRKHQTPVVTLYYIPDRDNGGFSAGGAGNVTQYKEWTERIARTLAHTPSIIIVEPDALAHAASFSKPARRTRLELLARTVASLKDSQPGHAVYIDAGHANWLSPKIVTSLLAEADVSRADGFSLNVSNFVSTADSIVYGEAISARLDGAHFVIDTSRNGASTPAAGIFNPPGRTLGTPPTTVIGHELVDAYLWIKVPGESDGATNGAPPAGVFWPDYAYELVRNSEPKNF